jgi:DNA polymerase/3'-5' exonuclease PolX
MILQEAQILAEQVRQQLAPHCTKIAIAGSIRREKPEVKDIEIVAIPKPWETGLFAAGIITVVSQWEKVLGDMEHKTDVKYTQRILPGGMKLDLFFATEDNWGNILMIRTGDAEFSKHMMIRMHNYRMTHKDGYAYMNGNLLRITDEEQLFNHVRLPYIPPKDRTLETLTKISTLKG